MHSRRLPDSIRYRSLASDELRAAFVADRLFVPGAIELLSADVDRAVIGGAVPLSSPLALAAPEALRASHFCERRELGALNVGGPGKIVADGRTFLVAPRECVYLGRGTRDIAFASDDPTRPATFFLASFPAHAPFPCAHAGIESARVLRVGSPEQASRRSIYQLIHPEGVQSCQLVMGFTELEPGSVWNTMPPHTHERRCEVYLYFDLPKDQRVLHLMGRPEETRCLLVGDREAVISPSWSLHTGVGTASYRFVWAMGGENQAFEDMQGLSLADLR